MVYCDRLQCTVLLPCSFESRLYHQRLNYWMYPSDSFSPPVVCVCVEEGGGRGRRRGRGRGERLGEGIEQESYLLVLATMFLTLPSQLAGEQEKL